MNGRDKYGSRLVFWQQAVRALQQVGALAETSRVVACAVAAPLAGQPGPRRVLEVGAGTGAITRAILPHLSAHDRLDLYEINAPFTAVLRRSFEHANGPAVQVYEDDIEQLPPGVRYDAIVSSLPLLNMMPDKVERVFARLLESLIPGGTLSYYDYWAKEVRLLIHGAAERQRVRAVLDVTRGYLERYEYQRRVIFRNVPPACVHYLRLSSQTT
jgi:phosphatidylethanolamine/phosphatidyl-N-methylethanolamine N-methyltransferase